MKMSEILTLIGAGYSRQEIEAMEAQEAVETPDPAPAPDPAPIPDPAPAPAPSPAQSSELLDAIKGLTAAMQKRNVISSAQPAAVQPDDLQTQADQILTKFLNT